MFFLSTGDTGWLFVFVGRLLGWYQERTGLNLTKSPKSPKRTKLRRKCYESHQSIVLGMAILRSQSLNKLQL